MVKEKQNSRGFQSFLLWRFCLDLLQFGFNQYSNGDSMRELMQQWRGSASACELVRLD